MSRTIVYALALGAIVLSPAIASAKGGSGMRGSSVQTSTQKSGIPFKKAKILHCGKVGRGNGSTMVTVCN